MRRVLLSLLALIATYQASAQLLQPVYSAPSPQAASVGEYGEVPVSHFTGTPDVSVPLFEIEAGDYKYPVGLSYHLASVKPNAQPGPVGLGWLLTDACISRTVRGVYDEKKADGVNGAEHGYYGHRTKMKNITNGAFDQYTKKNLTGWDNLSPWFELSADEFSFNVNGHSGLFYLNPDGGWTVISDEDIQVEFDPNSGFLGWTDINERFWGKVQHWSNRVENSRWYKSFTLVTPDGVRYEFGGLNAIDFSVSYYGRGSGDLIATAWHLSKITTPKGYVITFDYSTDQILCDIHYSTGSVVAYGFPASSASYLSRIIKGRSGLSGFLVFPAALTSITGPAGTMAITYRRDESYNTAYREYYPEALYWEDPEIRSENMYHYSDGLPAVEFFELLPVSDTGNMRENQRTLANCFRHDIIYRITMIPRYDGDVRSWYFEYTEGGRPFLLSVSCREGAPDISYHEVEGGGVVYLVPEYETPLDSARVFPEWYFRYYSGRDMPSDYLLPKSDAWGYWKGGSVTLSSFSGSSTIPSTLSFARTGALSEVYYPTGGSTLFEYESCDYGKKEKADHSSVEVASGVTGGLRVGRITRMDRSGKIHGITRFHYKNSIATNVSSGIAVALPSDTQVYVYSPTQYVIVKSSEGFPAVATNRNTPPVGYSSVIEELQDADENTLGYIRYRYSNFDADVFGVAHPDEPFIHSCNSGNTYVGVPYTSNSAERGKLQSREWYDDEYVLVRKETTRYSRVTNGSLIVADQRMVIFCQDPQYFLAAHVGWLTRTRTYSYLPVETVTTEYPSPSTSIQTTSSVSYNDSRLVTQSVSSRSDGTLTQKSYTYSGDSSLYDWMSSRHILNAPLSIQTTVNGISRTEMASYDSVMNNSGGLVPYIDRVTTARSGSDDPKVGYEVVSADGWGNPSEIVVDGLRSHLGWGFDGQRLVGVTENVVVSRGQMGGGGLRSTPEIGIEITGDFNGTLGKDYYYDGNLQPIMISNPNYLAARYEYDALGRLVAVGESDASDNWASSRPLDFFGYRYAEHVFRSPAYHHNGSAPQILEQEGDDPIRSEPLATGYTSSMELEFRSSDYHETHTSNRGMLHAQDTVTVRFKVSGFSYYHDSGDSLSLDATLLDVRLFRHRITSDSLVAILPLCVDSHSLEPVNWPDPTDTTGCTLQLPPGLYEVVFGGISAVMFGEEGGDELTRGAGGRSSGDPEEPDPDEPELEELSHYPSFTLLMDCLPLLEPDPVAPSIPVMTSWNRVRHAVSRDGTEANASQAIEWFDDFGRKELSVASGASPDGKDLASLLERDGWGREVKGWLPVVSEDSLTIVHPGADSVKTIAGITYGATEKPYSLTEYEQSPLSRVTGQFGPGSDWQNAGKKVLTAYLTNVASGAELSCRRFVCTSSNDGTSWTVTSPGYYAAGKLYVTRTTDEDGRQVWEFKDFDGNVVLSRAKLAANQYLDTYYVYDVFGNLQAVLPPLASASISGGSIPQDALLKYAYLYTYDDRDRCIVKKLPGAEPMYYVYDEADRAILTQDGNARARGEASFTLYDVFGRVAVTGICRNTVTPGARLRTYAKATYVGSSGALKGYDVDGITLASPEVLTASWYDTHSFTGDVLALTLAGSDTTLVYGTPTPVSYGLQTGSWSAVLGNKASGEPTGTWSIICSDRRNRVAKTVSSTHTGGRTIEDVEYTFRGSPLRRHIVHTDARGSSFFEDYRYSYDHEERLLNAIHSLNGTDSVAVVSNTFDSLGRLSSNSRTDNPQLTTQYSYNIRSWTTGISSPYFTETLYYNAARPGSGTGIQWGGNISSMEWDGTKAYDYAYDGLSRLTRAVYAGSASNSRQYTYDGHGNITGLTEGTTPHSYTYIGNHLSSSQYDANGNMTADAGTGIASVRYNVLNLPEEIVKSNGDTVRYTYSAAGAKLRESVIPVSGSPVHTDYVGNLVYRDGLLGRILVEGGAIAAKDSTLVPAYEFAFTDHLGNVRALVRAGEVRYRKTEYGPYGEVLSEDWTSQPVSPGGGGDGGDELIEVGDDEEDPGSRGGMLRAGVRSNGIIQTVMDSPYRFGGKERLDESGLELYDFGARQYTPSLPRWLTMDPLAEKYYGVSPYVYCAGNPGNYADPFGLDIVIRGSDSTSVTIFTTTINKEWDLSSSGVNFRGNHYFDGLESATSFIDMMGIADPSFVCDGISALLNFYQGKVGDGFLSSLAVILPYVGDLPKLRHSGDYWELYQIVTHSHHIIPRALFKKIDDLSFVLRRDSELNRLVVPMGFHGNHPAYSKWIESQLQSVLHETGRLTPESVNKIIQKATEEINNAYINYIRTGENMNIYFKKLTQK